MKFPIIFFLFCFLSSSKLSADSDIVVLSDQMENKMIGTYVYYLEDPDQNYSFEGIESGKFNSLFQRFNKDGLSFGNKQSTFWFRFSVVHGEKKDWILSILNYNLDSLSYYFKDKFNTWVEIKSGAHLPISTRKYKTGYYAFDLVPGPQDTTVYYLKVSTFIFQCPLMIHSKEKYITTLHKYSLIKGMYYGFLLLILIYNLALYNSFRDKTFVYYILYILTLGLLNAEHAGFTAHLWGDKLHFLWYRAPSLIACAAFFYMIFSNKFLELKRQLPLVYKLCWFLFMPVYVLVIILNSLHLNLQASIINQAASFILLTTMMISAFILYKRKFRPALYYILAVGSYFIGNLVFVLKTMDILPFNLFTANSMEIGSAIEMALFSISLASKIDVIKREKQFTQDALVQSLKENENLIKEQNKLLEEKVISRTLELQATNENLSRERDKSDSLLLNILPADTARELKENGYYRPRILNNVTVLFTDFKDFTRISEFMKPAELVSMLDHYFGAMDKIIENFQLDRIKTIGDSYMAASGLDQDNEQSVLNAVLAAKEIIKCIDLFNQDRINKGLEPLEIRIGIHTGNVVAGIVGTKKFAYDIWGDTVNTASRIESSGVPGKINISQHTYNFIKDQIPTTHRGKLPVKNKGELDMYLVD